MSPARTPVSTSHSAAVSTPVPARRWPVRRRGSCLERLLDRTTDIRISEDRHGPADARRYTYVPTYILRGLTELHLEFTVAEDTPR